MNICLKLFYTFIKIGLFSFGGGNAILPLIRQEVVSGTHWLKSSEFTDLVAVSQATPGPIAVNGATYVGYKVAGWPGSIAATLGVILPTFIIMIIFTKFYLKLKDHKYIKHMFTILVPTTIGLMAAAPFLVVEGSFSGWKSILICAAAFIAAVKFKADPILLTLLSGLAGLILFR